MPKRRLSTVLADMIGPDWIDTTLAIDATGVDLVLEVEAPGFCWIGRLSQAEYHRLVTIGTNWLGRVPRTRRLETERAEIYA